MAGMMFASHHPSILCALFRPVSQRKSTTSIAISISVLTSPALSSARWRSQTEVAIPTANASIGGTKCIVPAPDRPLNPQQDQIGRLGIGHHPVRYPGIGVEVAAGERKHQRSLPCFLPAYGRTGGKFERSTNTHVRPCRASVPTTPRRAQARLIWIKLSVASRHVMRAQGTVRSAKMPPWKPLRPRTGDPSTGGRHRRRTRPDYRGLYIRG